MEMKSGTALNTLYAELTYIELRTVNVEAEHCTVRTSILHTLQNSGCSLDFNIYYCTDYISCLLPMVFPVNDSSKFCLMIKFEYLQFRN